MRCAALLAILTFAASAQAQPLFGEALIEEKSVAIVFQDGPASLPNVLQRGGEAGGIALGTHGVRVESFGATFAFNSVTGRRTNVLRANLEADATPGIMGPVSATASAFRYVVIDLDQSARVHIRGEIGTEYVIGEGDWGSAVARFKVLSDSDVLAEGEASLGEGDQEFDFETVVMVDESDWIVTFGFTIETAASLTTASVIDQEARAWGSLHIELLPLGCSYADMAEPYGVLDATDMLEFLDAWSDRLPIADYAIPSGYYTLDDVLAYLTLFDDGCP